MSLPMPVINDSSLHIIGESVIARLKLKKQTILIYER